MSRDPLEAVSEHNDQFTRCPACSQTFLFADAGECDGCGAWAHPGCLDECPACDNEYCPGCIPSGICSGCRDDARYKEASGGYLRP